MCETMYSEKFKRGQIWWLVKDQKEEEEKMQDPEHHLACKTRPWLIVSVQNFTEVSGTVTMVPIYTMHKETMNRYMIPILMKREQRFIKCSEFQTLNFKDVNGNYECVVSPYVMKKVEMAMGNCLHIIDRRDPTLNQLEEMIQNKINFINNNRKMENQKIGNILDKMQELLHMAETISVAGKEQSSVAVTPAKKRGIFRCNHERSSSFKCDSYN